MIWIEGLRYATSAGFELALPNLAIETGARVAVIGPSGSGKTTFLNLLAGLLSPQSGRIVVAGTDVAALSPKERLRFRARSVGFVFQDFDLVAYLSALENILYPARIANDITPDRAMIARARALAERTGIADRLWAKPARMSQGEQQRTAICRALLRAPALVLADEATGNLDPKNKQASLDLLFDEVERAGATLIAVTHDHQLLDRFDRVIDFAALPAEL
ncbi:MAG: ABC transporter ATP-binding protein [Pseudomonadota bacterium]